MPGITPNTVAAKPNLRCPSRNRHPVGAEHIGIVCGRWHALRRLPAVAPIKAHLHPGAICGKPQITLLGCRFREIHKRTLIGRRPAAISLDDRERYGRFCLAMLEEGVRLIERGIWYISAAHTPAHIAHTLSAVEDSLRAMNH